MQNMSEPDAKKL